ncbi:MAG: hypothetical protein QW054_07360, partial [Candidatus Micrarchaeia archaeon]
EAEVEYVECEEAIIGREAEVMEVKYTKELKADPSAYIGKSEKISSLSRELPRRNGKETLN